MTITVTLSGSCDWIELIAASFTGVETTDALIASTVTATGSSTTASSGAKTNFSVGDLAIGVFSADNGVSTTYGSGTGWVSPQARTAENGLNLTYQIVDADQGETATCSVTSGMWGAVLAGFKATSAGAASIIPLLLHQYRARRD